MTTFLLFLGLITAVAIGATAIELLRDGYGPLPMDDEHAEHQRRTLTGKRGTDAAASASASTIVAPAVSADVSSSSGSCSF
jgi:hypothetical protein